MDLKIIEEQEKKLTGMNFFGNPFSLREEWNSENEIGMLWKRFLGFLQSVAFFNTHPYDSLKFYEIHIINRQTEIDGNFEVFVGTEINIDDIQLVTKKIPSGVYASFTLRGEAITSDWNYNLEDFLSSGEYRISKDFFIQVYDQRFLGMDKIKESELDVLIPLI